jgi:hypothetical protein
LPRRIDAVESLLLLNMPLLRELDKPKYWLYGSLQLVRSNSNELLLYPVVSFQPVDYQYLGHLWPAFHVDVPDADDAIVAYLQRA